QEPGGIGGHRWFVIENRSQEKNPKGRILSFPPGGRLFPRRAGRGVPGFDCPPPPPARAGHQPVLPLPRRPACGGGGWWGAGGGGVGGAGGGGGRGGGGGGDGVIRRVYTIAATPGLMSGWEYVPPDRPESMASIDGEWGSKDLDVIGWAAAPGMPAALVRRGA